MVVMERLCKTQFSRKLPVKEVPLTNSNQKAKVDDCDFEFVLKHGPWRFDRLTGYAVNGEGVFMQDLIYDRAASEYIFGENHV